MTSIRSSAARSSTARSSTERIKPQVAAPARLAPAELDDSKKARKKAKLEDSGYSQIAAQNRPKRPAQILDGPIAGLTQQLAKAAQRETAVFALGCLAKYSGAIGERAKALIKDPAFVGQNFPTDRQQLTEVISTALAPDDTALASKARKLLTDEMTVFRQGEQQDRGFAIDPVSLDDLPAPRHLDSSSGFSLGVEDVDLKLPHSLHNIQSYVRDRLGSFFIDDLLNNQRHIEFHEGPAENALASLKMRGFDTVQQLRGPKSTEFNRIYLAHNSSSGEIRYAMGEISGQDRLAHMQKLVRMAKLDTADGPLRVEPQRVEVFSDRLLDDQDIYLRYSRALLASGTVPAHVVVGFKNGLLKELGGRAANARRLEHLQQALGPDPAATLLARANQSGDKKLLKTLRQLGTKAEVLGIEPARLFRFKSRIQEFQEVERVLTQLVQKSPSSAALLDDVIGSSGFKVTVSGHVAERVPEDTFVDQGVVTYLNDKGEQRSLLLTRNPYGDLAHSMGKVLVDNKVENVFVVGTAGGLEANSELGDVHAPDKVVSADGSVQDFANSAIPVVANMDRVRELGVPVKVGGHVVEVNSPLDETNAYIQGLKTDGYELVEMELADLLRATQNSQTKVSGLYVVSDLPGTEQTLESHTGGHLQDALGTTADVLIEQLGMRDVALVGDPKEPTRTGFKGAAQLAEKMLEQRGLKGPKYLLMRYTISRYLLNGLSDNAITSLLADNATDPMTTTQLAPRWRNKIERSLATPFDNDQVINHLLGLGEELGQAVEVIGQAGGTAENYKLHILGSIVKGRAAVGSDVDVLLQCDDDEINQKVFASAYGHAGAPEDSLVVVGGYEYAMQRGDHYGELVDIGSGRELLQDSGLLVELYSEAIASFGIEVKRDANNRYQVVDRGFSSGTADAPERETEAVAERVLEYEKAYRRFMNTDFILSHVEDTAPLADVTHLPFERLVSSGEALIASRLVKSLNADNLADYLGRPEGQALLGSARGQAFLQQAGLVDAQALQTHLQDKGVAGLPLAALVDGETAASLMGLSDPLDRLALVLAAAERARDAHTAGSSIGEDFAFFATEVDRAQAREDRSTVSNPLYTRLNQLARPSQPSGEVKLPQFYQDHLASGHGSIQVGPSTITFGDDGVGRVDMEAMLQKDEMARIVVQAARDNNVTIGFWGGSGRDFLLNRERDATSDFDLIYNSAQPGLKSFKEQVVKDLKAQFGDKIPWIDLSVDINPDKQMRGPYRGLSIEKVGVLADGRVFDFTGRGVKDMSRGVLHYNAPRPDEGPGISSVFRMVGASLQNRHMKFDRSTKAQIKQVLGDYYGPETENLANIKSFYEATKGKNRRQLKQYMAEQREVHGGRVPGENAADFLKTLKYIVNGGVETDPQFYLQTLQKLGIVDFLKSMGAQDKLQPLINAANQAQSGQVTRNFEATAATAASARFDVNVATGDEIQVGESWQFAVPPHLQHLTLRAATLIHRKDAAHWHESLEGVTAETWDPTTWDKNPARIALEAQDQDKMWHTWRNPDYRKASKRAELAPPDMPERDNFHDVAVSMGQVRPEQVRITNRGKGDPSKAIANVHSLELFFFPEVKNPVVQEQIYTPGTQFHDLEKGILRASYGGGPDNKGRYPKALMLGPEHKERAQKAAALHPKFAFLAGFDPGPGAKLDDQRLLIDLKPGTKVANLELAVGDVDVVASQKKNEDKHYGRKGAAFVTVTIQPKQGEPITVMDDTNVPPAAMISGVPDKDYVVQPGDQLVIESKGDITHLMGYRLTLSESGD